MIFTQKIYTHPKTGDVYRHYKGNLYEVIGVGHHTETLEPMVVYRALYDSPEFGNHAIWARPLSMFTETITYGETIMPRFLLTSSDK